MSAFDLVLIYLSCIEQGKRFWTQLFQIDHRGGNGLFKWRQNTFETDSTHGHRPASQPWHSPPVVIPGRMSVLGMNGPHFGMRARHLGPEVADSGSLQTRDGLKKLPYEGNRL
ncbi:hypothetical protein CDAR_241601 [Caerostris darwini]|uniref:Uncharacterized protein n=1 Tax=Caerostris darwini TaxID=1538125 RepID=A0AAV4QJD7_9ARAC|nr:hypothetical protein CDAR_241601 [Caerostris darwini]